MSSTCLADADTSSCCPLTLDARHTVINSLQQLVALTLVLVHAEAAQLQAPQPGEHRQLRHATAKLARACRELPSTGLNTTRLVPLIFSPPFDSIVPAIQLAA